MTPTIASAVPDASAEPPKEWAWAFDCSDTSSKPPKTGKSIGHTSVVFKLELDTGKKAAWKPNAKNVKDRYKGEIAAYRLGQALGIPNVPPACVRVFDKSVGATLQPDATKLFDAEAIVEPDGKVYGVVIPWIEGLQFWPLEKDPLKSDMKMWLTAKKDVPGGGKMELARQASTLIVFDFLTGNWDRYSGENVGMDKTGTKVLFIDNDAAFMTGPPKESVARNKALLAQTDRFSQSLVDALRKLDVQKVFGEEAPGRPLLSPAMTTLVGQRVKEALLAIDAKVATNGEAETLFFP